MLISCDLIVDKFKFSTQCWQPEVDVEFINGEVLITSHVKYFVFNMLTWLSTYPHDNKNI